MFYTGIGDHGWGGTNIINGTGASHVSGDVASNSMQARAYKGRNAHPVSAAIPFRGRLSRFTSASTSAARKPMRHCITPDLAGHVAGCSNDRQARPKGQKPGKEVWSCDFATAGRH